MKFWDFFKFNNIFNMFWVDKSLDPSHRRIQFIFLRVFSFCILFLMFTQSWQIAWSSFNFIYSVFHIIEMRVENYLAAKTKTHIISNKLTQFFPTRYKLIFQHFFFIRLQLRMELHHSRVILVQACFNFLSWQTIFTFSRQIIHPLMCFLSRLH